MRESPRAQTKQERPIEEILPILNPEQIKIAGLESVISSITLADDGKIKLPRSEEHSTRIEEWSHKEGVIDAKSFEGAAIVIYNSNTAIPDGCPDLRGRRSGEYHPNTKTCFVDLSESFSYLDEKYVPSFLEQFVRHELRHHIVNNADADHNAKNNSQESRYASWDGLKDEQKETAAQLAYLDELHSQYFDAVDGDLLGRKTFTDNDAEFYTIYKNGRHTEVATTEQENKALVSELFSNLQASLLLSWADGENTGQHSVSTLPGSIGAILATERSLPDALEKVKAFVKGAASSPEVKQRMETYLKTYSPKAGYNMPVVSPEIKRILGLEEH